MKNKRVFLFVICYIAYTSIYIARLNLSMASPGLKEAGVLTTSQLGLLGSAFSVVYAVGRLLNGTVSDSKAPYLMISAGLLLAGVSNLLVGLFPPFVCILLLWCANGFAQSMLWSSVLCVISALYDQQTAKKKTSLMVTSVAAGNILGILVSMLLIDRFGLRWAFVIPGGLTLVMAAAVLLTLQEIPAPSVGADQKHVNIFHLIRDPEIRLMVFPAFFHGVMKDNVTLWMAVFFVDRFAIDLNASGWFVLLIPVVGFAGRMLYPVCYRLCGEQEHKVSRLGFYVCITAAALLCFNGLTPVPAMIALSLVYAAASVINTSFLSIYPIRFVRTGNVASVSGIMDFVTYLGNGAGALVFGFMIEKWGYLPMFAVWIAVSAASILLLFRLTGKKFLSARA